MQQSDQTDREDRPADPLLVEALLLIERKAREIVARRRREAEGGGDERLS